LQLAPAAVLELLLAATVVRADAAAAEPPPPRARAWQLLTDLLFRAITAAAPPTAEDAAAPPTAEDAAWAAALAPRAVWFLYESGAQSASAIDAVRRSCRAGAVRAHTGDGGGRRPLRWRPRGWRRWAAPTSRCWPCARPAPPPPLPATTCGSRPSLPRCDAAG
jgi:hypothetical protein